jgi:hypothetical protein
MDYLSMLNQYMKNLNPNAITLNFFKKRFPNDKFPPIIIHITYVMVAITFTYLYHHKFVHGADFSSIGSPGGIWAVANFESIKPIQFRIFLPLIFKGLSIITSITDKPLFFLINSAQVYLILLSFYFLLNKHFQNKIWNGRLALIIIYPMIWNLVIMNGQFFYMDFGLLLFMVIGYYFIVSKRNNWLLLTFFIGLLNHGAVIYLIVSYLLYNYKYIFRLKTIFYAAAMTIIFVGTLTILNLMMPSTTGGQILVNNLPRNIELLLTLQKHLLLRDFLFNFGGLYFFVLFFLVTGAWKKFKGPYLYIHLVLIPFMITLMLTFSVEEMRNYSAIIPNILIMSLFLISTFENSFLKPWDKIYAQSKEDTK